MKKRELVKYFDKEWKEMKTGLQAYIKNDDQKDLHRFRVQVKKLRAFFILAESTVHHPELTRDFKPVKKIFKKAGEIRSAFMNQELGKTYPLGNLEFINSQKLLQIEADRAFRLKDAKYLAKMKEVRNTIREKIKAISDVHINIFYHDRLLLIEDSIAKPRFNEQLHTDRKQVKVLLYNHKLIHTVLHTGFNENYLHQVQEAIGNWHDHDEAVLLFSGNKLSEKAILSHLNARGIKLKKRIKDLAKNFYDRATITVEVPVEQLS